MTDDPSEVLLDIFATSNDPAERVRTLSELMTLKAIPKRADDIRFGTGVSRWVDLANRRDTAPRDRLLAIAELIRATQQMKKRQPALLARAHLAFEQPLPPLTLLDDAEARLNVARACSMTDAPWLQAYRADSVANETAPKPRTEMMEGIVSRSDSVADVLGLLLTAFEGIKPETDKPAESLAKRLARTLEIFRSTVLSSLLEAGPDVGKKFDGFIRSTLASTGRPKDDEVQLDLTREVALTLHDLVRSRFSLATEPQTFLALQYCRTFFPGASWPKGVKREMDLLVQDVSEALVMLGRMGVPNQDLLSRLELTCGIKERARVVATQIADKHTEIDESIRNWLRTGRMVNTIAASSVLEESLLANMDEALGMLLIEARAYKERRESEQRLASSLEIFDPSLSSEFQGLITQSSAMLTGIEDLAKRRQLDLMGTVGQEMEFAPKYFEVLGVLHGTRGLVRRPAIVKTDAGGTLGSVVKRGLVE